MTVFNVIQSYGSWLICLAILENFLVLFLLIDSILYHFRYKKQDKMIKEFLNNGRV